MRDAKTAKEMWTSIRNVFQRHTLLNKLSARRSFYTAIMSENESVLHFANRIRQLAATLKSMSVSIDESEMAMALLNGLPDQYAPLISALDALGTEDNKNQSLKFDFLKARVMQEEQRIALRNKDALAKSEASALVSQRQSHKHDGKCASCKTRPFCEYCKKLGHLESKCWKKFPHLNPHKKKAISAFIASHTDDDPVVCLVAKYQKAGIPEESQDWFIDSGCSNHMTYNKSLFLSYTSSPESNVKLGNGQKAHVMGIGNIDVNILVNGKSTRCRLMNVLHVPHLGYQLLSVPTWDKQGLETTFKSGRVRVLRDGVLCASGTMYGNLYKLDTAPNTLLQHTALVANSLRLWHERLAHIDPSTIMHMCASGAVSGIKLSSANPENGLQCSGCILGKGHRAIIPKKTSSRATRLLELVHSDVNGPLETPSHGGSRYFITFIDDYSKWTVVFTMRKKSDALTCFKKFHKLAEKHTGEKVNRLNIIKRTQLNPEKVKALRTDNGGEYISGPFKSYLEENGIKHQLTIAYTPQQNGVAERMNRTLLDLVRSMLHHANMDKRFWAEALSTAVYIRNRVTSRSLPTDTTPHHLWLGKAPDLSHARVFGCKCWYVTPKKKVSKLDPRSREALMIGYSTQSKGYKLWDVESHKPVVSRDVTFTESTPKQVRFNTKVDVIDQGGDVDICVDDVTTPDMVGHESSEDTVSHESSEEISDTGSDDESHDPVPEVNPAPRRSSRVSKPPSEWWKTSTSSGHALSAQVIPASYKAATSLDMIDFWKPGIDREHDCLTRNKTWTYVDRQPGMHVLPSKYVFRVKNGGPKARLVVLGCRQLYGTDYTETFAPVVKLSTVRTLLALVASMDLELEQMDVVTAFLNGDLEEDIYMEVPEGFRNSGNLNKVCKLLKALYGLKQAPRQWYAKIHKFLVDVLGFSSSLHDPCLYVRHRSESILIVALYVDDLLIAGSDKSEIAKLKGELSKRFEMKDLGPANVMLGIEIKRHRVDRKLFFSQSACAKEVLTRFGMERSKAVSTPMEKLRHLTAEELTSPAGDVPYRQVIGSLMYLMTGTRPDIAFAIGKLSQHCEKPLHCHWVALKRVLRYVSGTRTHGILFDGRAGTQTRGYSDSDWAGCVESRKSTSGCVFCRQFCS